MATTQRHKWALNISSENTTLPKPVGNVPAVIEHQNATTEQDLSSLKIAKAWETAQSFRPIMTTGILYFMTPSQASLIFLSVIFTALLNHVTTIFTVNSTFAPFEDSKGRYSLILQKMLFILFQLVGCGLLVYKLGQYGLLPTTDSDWLPYFSVKPHLEQGAIRIF